MKTHILSGKRTVVRTGMLLLLLMGTTAFSDKIGSPCLDSLFIYLKRERRPEDLTVKERNYVRSMDEKCRRFQDEEREKEKKDYVHGKVKKGVILGVILTAVTSIAIALTVMMARYIE
ncbi:MAG: hypothetical protein JW913_10480 [Chitinispirillaceae bacterium]|nr:hypothetical protein [Chitinispirillaceae bacterium]